MLKKHQLQNVLAIFLIIAAVIGVYFQDSIWDWWSLKKLAKDPRPPIAKFDNVKGAVKFRLPDSVNYYRAHFGVELRAHDTVMTEANSKAVIVFSTGLKVEVQPDTILTVNDKPQSPTDLEFTFLKGGAKVLGTEKAETPEVDAPTRQASPVVSDAPEREESPLKIKSSLSSKKEPLPESYIASVMRDQKNLFYRCYAQGLTKNSQSSGRIDISFMIETDGRVARPRVIGSTIPDAELQQCVANVIARVRFKSFNGDPMIIDYPINFE